MKVAVLTLGCRVNQSESAVIQGSLERHKVTIVDLEEKPDICIVNTCSVTAKSDYNSRQLIRRAARGGAEVIVTGCYAHLRKDEVMRISGVTHLIENPKKYEIVKLITGREDDLVFSGFSRSRLHLKVQDGCNGRCSYCSVPLARGGSKSVPLDEAIRRAREIEASGCNEVVITGIHLGSYGQDLTDKTDIKRLIADILKHTRIKRIRLSSLEISEVDDGLIELFQDIRLCRHLHLPLQSGNDRILGLMKRSYTALEYISRVDRIFSRIHDIAIGSDVIVGFPGETRQEFLDTCNLLDSLPFSYLHVFPFSARPRTDAGRMHDRVPADSMKQRLDMIREIGRKKKNTYLQKQLEKILDVIMEEKTDAGDYAMGTSGNYLKVKMPVVNAKSGSLVCAKITGVEDSLLNGILIP